MKTISEYKETILLIIVCIFLILNFISLNTVKTDVKSYKKQIKDLQIKIDSAYQVNKVIDFKIGKVNDKIDSVNDEINQVDVSIKKIKKTTNEKINNVDVLAPNELELFFTNRYK